MKASEHLFAYGSLVGIERFITSINIVTKRFSRAGIGFSDVLYAITDDFEDDRISHSQRKAVVRKPVSKEYAHELKEFFLMVYEDKEGLVDYLNKEVSENFWQREKAKKRDFDETQAVIDIVIKSTSLASFLAD